MDENFASSDMYVSYKQLICATTDACNLLYMMFFLSWKADQLVIPWYIIHYDIKLNGVGVLAFVGHQPKKPKKGFLSSEDEFTFCAPANR